MASTDKNFDLKEVASHFVIFGQFLTSVPFGTGHINDTFLVTFDQAGTFVNYIVQRINHNVFKNPVAVMENIGRVSEHMKKKLDGVPEAARRSLEFHPTHDGKYVHIDTEGNFWRVYSCVEKCRTYDIIESADQAFQAARAFGNFQKALFDLPGGRLNDTIPFFHHTPKRFEALEDAIRKDTFKRASSCKAEIDFAINHKALCAKLLDLHAEGKLPERITHNDCKLNNVLIDDATGEGICVIDLDTIMPGFVLYDFGDMIRTSTSPAKEDEQDLSKVTMRFEMFEALVKGYLDAVGNSITPIEKELLPFSGKLITFTIGIRFLTDYLNGDVYFKTHRDGHNLDRCRTQFKLIESIETQEKAMDALVASL